MKRHIAWNFAGTVATTVATLVSVPLFLHFYGAERYGILATIWVVLGYFSVFDFGMGQAVINALAQTPKDHSDQLRTIWWTALLLNITIGVIIGILGLVVLATAGSEMILSPGPLMGEIVDSLPIITLMIPLALIYPILIGNFDSRQQFGIANAHQVAGTVLFQTLPFLALLLFDATLLVAIAASVLARVLQCVVLIAQSISQHNYWPPRFERSLVRRLGGFGGWVALSSGAGALLETADRVMITSFLGGAPAAWYSLAYSVVSRLRSIPQALLRTLFPRISADSSGSEQAVAASVRGLSLVLVPLISIAIFAIEPLLSLWIGSAAADSTSPLARIMLAGVFVNCLAYMPFVVMQAGGRPRRVALIHMAETPIFLGLMWFGVSQLGLVGAAAIWALRLYTDAIWMFIAARMHKTFIREGLFQSLIPLTCCLLTVATSLPLEIQALIGVGLLLVWAITDTYLARRRGATLNLLALAHAIGQASSRALMRARQLKSGQA